MIKIFALFDKKASEFTQPMYFPNKAVAYRYYDNMLNNPQNLYMRADLDLYYLGTYESVTGVIQPLDMPEYVCSFVDDGGVNE